MIVTQAEMAVLKGVSRQAVGKAIKSGRLGDAVIRKGGKVWLHQEMALENWDKNTAQTFIPTVRIAEALPAASPVVNSSAAKGRTDLRRKVEQMPDDAIPDFNTSRAKREHYLAKLAGLDVQERKKELISAEEVKKTAYGIGREVMQNLLNLSDRLSFEFAGETDPAEIHKTLNREIAGCCEGLAAAGEGGE